MSFTDSFEEGHHTAEWLLSEAPGHQARDTATLASGNDLPSGRVLGQVSATGKFTELDPSNNDGSEVAAGILYDNVDASAADVECVVIARGAEVKEAVGLTNDLGTEFVSISWPAGATDPQKAQARTELLAAGIVVRS
jgi:Bacteriophage lambda head decoration protein D